MGWGKYAAVACCLVGLSACSTDTRFDAADDVAKARYVHDGPPALTLYTMISTKTGSGAHTSLMINASERVIFDPAGSVAFTGIPEHADVLYGITPPYARAYASAHARETYYVVIQRVEVSPEVAEQALALAKKAGPVSQAFCANATSTLLGKLPGFDSVKTSFFPRKVMDDFGAIAGVTTRELRETDGDDKVQAVLELEAEMAKAAAAAAPQAAMQ